MHMVTPVLADHQKFTFINSVWTWNAFSRTCLERSPIGAVGERKSKKPVRLGCFHDGDDDDISRKFYNITDYFFNYLTLFADPDEKKLVDSAR